MDGIFDLEPLGDSVIGGFEQANAGLLPSPLVADLSVLRNTLAEGMTIQFEHLCQQSDNTPEQQANRENFMAAQRKYEDNIPGYTTVAGKMIFEDY